MVELTQLQRTQLATLIKSKGIGPRTFLEQKFAARGGTTKDYIKIAELVQKEGITPSQAAQRLGLVGSGERLSVEERSDLGKLTQQILRERGLVVRKTIIAPRAEPKAVGLSSQELRMAAALEAKGMTKVAAIRAVRQTMALPISERMTLAPEYLPTPLVPKGLDVFFPKEIYGQPVLYTTPIPEKPSPPISTVEVFEEPKGLLEKAYFELGREEERLVQREPLGTFPRVTGEAWVGIRKFGYGAALFGKEIVSEKWIGAGLYKVGKGFYSSLIKPRETFGGLGARLERAPIAVISEYAPLVLLPIVSRRIKIKPRIISTKVRTQLPSKILSVGDVTVMKTPAIITVQAKWFRIIPKKYTYRATIISELGAEVKGISPFEQRIYVRPKIWDKSISVRLKAFWGEDKLVITPKIIKKPIGTIVTTAGVIKGEEALRGAVFVGKAQRIMAVTPSKKFIGIWAEQTWLKHPSAKIWKSRLQLLYEKSWKKARPFEMPVKGRWWETKPKDIVGFTGEVYAPVLKVDEFLIKKPTKVLKEPKPFYPTAEVPIEQPTLYPKQPKPIVTKPSPDIRGLGETLAKEIAAFDVEAQVIQPTFLGVPKIAEPSMVTEVTRIGEPFVRLAPRIEGAVIQITTPITKVKERQRVSVAQATLVDQRQMQKALQGLAQPQAVRQFQPQIQIQRMVVGVSPKQMIGLAQPQAVRQKQLVPFKVPQIQRQITVPPSIVTPTIITLPSIGTFGAGRYKLPTQIIPRKFRYTPSLVAMEFGITTREVPGRILTGLEIRPLISRRKRRRKKK